VSILKDEKGQDEKERRREDMRASPDPWKHRGAHMKCNTCMWYAPKITDEGSPPIGRCRRHAPTMSGYPVVFIHDWCGDHKLNENAL